MSKNYILEPTEMTFSQENDALVVNFNDDESLSSIAINTSWDELKAMIPIGAVIDIDGANKFIVAEYSDNGSDIGRFIFATESGNPPTDDDVNGASIKPSYPNHGTVVSGKMYIYGVEGLTHTVSIYTGEEDPVDLYPVKNFTYEHAEVAKNDIEDIIQAIYTHLGAIESQESHGYSPADRLVIAVAKLHGVVPVTALTTGNYPNQMKRIAAIIRGDFGE